MKTAEAIKIKLTHAAEELTDEAARYTQLAQSLALLALTHPESGLDYRTRAREHLIRAETFKAAASIVNRKS